MTEMSLEAREVIQALSTTIDEKMSRVDAAVAALEVVARQMERSYWDPKSFCYLRELSKELRNHLTYSGNCGEVDA